MIRKNEILAIATETGLDKHVVEKDYMLGWLLAGIRQHEIGQNWAFKGGTCLTKCYFDTYRFSEDLDFTVNDNKYLDEKYLQQAFTEIGDWIYEHTGMVVPEERLKFESYENPRGMPSCQGRIYYRGPTSSSAPKQMPRIKLDLTADERVVDKLVVRPVHHPYSDRPESGIEALCYSYAELFAEKTRALSERTRPRDLYDVINLYRRPESAALINDIRRILKEKCIFKNIPFPSYDIVLQHKEVCLAGWSEQLSHQLRIFQSSEGYWNELPQFFEWLSK
jgi:predicted nucleotidyltransferase component of viral defense system